MPKELVEGIENVYQYPTHLATCSGSLTVGDLHGNAVKLFHMLFKHQVIRFKPGLDPNAEYKKLVSLYEALDTKNWGQNNPEEVVREIRDFFQKLEVKDPNVLIRLIGNELADRGCNDYMTLKLLEFLNQNKIKTTVLLSNHGSVFLNAYERYVLDPNNQQFVSNIHLMSSPEQWKSITPLEQLINQGIVSKEEITSICGTSL